MLVLLIQSLHFFILSFLIYILSHVFSRTASFFTFNFFVSSVDFFFFSPHSLARSWHAACAHHRVCFHVFLLMPPCLCACTCGHMIKKWTGVRLCVQFCDLSPSPSIEHLYLLYQALVQVPIIYGSGCVYTVCRCPCVSILVSECVCMCASSCVIVYGVIWWVNLLDIPLVFCWCLWPCSLLCPHQMLPLTIWLRAWMQIHEHICRKWRWVIFPGLER